ncbi:MAG: hypothetical protein U9R79_12930 [Armatimonadota bacterium]|nr:hypothetical protein [Armatimonadota bacterium]
MRCLAGISLDGPIPGADGADLLAANPAWLAVDAAGESVVGRPCWAIPEARRALMAYASDVAPHVDGIVVMSLPELPADERPAWQAGFNAPVLETYQERYGGDPRQAEEGSLQHLLFVRLKGQMITELFRELSAAADVPLYVATPPSDVRPETALWRHIDLHALLAGDLVAGVIMVSEEPVDLRRYRLHTQRPILAGLMVPGDAAAAAAAVMRSRDGGVLLVTARERTGAEWLQAFAQAADAYRRGRRQRLRLAEAVESGELRVVAGVKPEGELDQATIHGVGQSFQVARPVAVSAVGLLCTLRGAGPAAMPDLQVRICPDADGRPDTERVLAEGRIPAAAFAEAGPGYQWGYARIDPPLALEADTTYWLHAPESTAGGNSYVWRVAPDGRAYPHGHAWSSRYDYEPYDWVFRVLAEDGGAGE